MIVRFRRGNMAETRPVHGKQDHHVSAGRKRDGYKQLPVSVEFPKYGNTLFRPVRWFRVTAHVSIFVKMFEVWFQCLNYHVIFNVVFNVIKVLYNLCFVTKIGISKLV